MGTGSPGSVWVLHLLSAEPDPGSILRTTPGADHVRSLGVPQGQNRLSAGHDYEGSALRTHSGWTRARQSRDWQWAAVETAALAVGGSGDGGTGAGRGCTRARQWTGAAATGDKARARALQLERRQGMARDLGSGTGWLTARQALEGM